MFVRPSDRNATCLRHRGTQNYFNVDEGFDRGSVLTIQNDKFSPKMPLTHKNASHYDK